ncbi:MAG: nucleoside phosphorylase [Alphaproteobacteria bacterium]|nr:nucleoside phosphorylase [Alphaproteobacteria bacterium]
MMRLAALCGFAAEARLAQRFGLAAFATAGDAARGRALAARAAETADSLLSFGIAGGLAPRLAPGTLLLPRAVITASGERLAVDADLHRRLLAALAAAGLHAETGDMLGLEAVVATPQAKTALHARHGALAVDLESLHVAHATQAAGKPFLVLRAVADPAGRGLPAAALVGLHPSGRAAPGRVLAALLRQPGQIPDLMATARDTRRALSALRAALAATHGTL